LPPDENRPLKATTSRKIKPSLPKLRTQQKNIHLVSYRSLSDTKVCQVQGHLDYFLSQVHGHVFSCFPSSRPCPQPSPKITVQSNTQSLRIGIKYSPVLFRRETVTPLLSALVRHQTLPPLLRVLVWHEPAPLLLRILVQHEKGAAALARPCPARVGAGALSPCPELIDTATTRLFSN
jgi:hypothetical protein